MGLSEGSSLARTGSRSSSATFQQTYDLIKKKVNEIHEINYINSARFKRCQMYDVGRMLGVGRTEVPARRCIGQ